ncbi:LuxR C-terminal-related transcriptional regulator [Amycolatopsis sp. NPDC059657]|uniref:helix-turn-helix transcriptional regulator n=1 Tax=Amycolatopsis sp. NPDC059657 TaxID=3346899 RepID=UPI00366E606D
MEIRVGVVVHDQFFSGNLLERIRASSDIDIVPAEEHCRADVMVVVTASLDDILLDALEKLAANAENPGQCVVLVSGPVRERHLAQALSCGVVSILAREVTTPQLIVRAVLASHAGRSVMPETITRWLVNESRALQATMFTVHGLEAGGLTPREVEVLRMLAEGHGTLHIAGQLRYSERTIKKILQDIMTRHSLRNRAHAVAYGYLVGAI